MKPLCFSYDPLACLNPSIVFNDLAHLVVYSDALTSIFHVHFARKTSYHIFTFIVEGSNYAKVTYSSTCKTQYMYVHIMWVKVMDTNES